MKMPNGYSDSRGRLLLCILLRELTSSSAVSAVRGRGRIVADAAGDAEAQEGFPLPCNTYLRLLIQDCKMIVQGIMSPCQVQRGGIKNRYNITPFPLGVCK